MDTRVLDMLCTVLDTFWIRSLVLGLDTQLVLDTLVLLQFGYVWIRGVSVFCWNNDVCA